MGDMADYYRDYEEELCRDLKQDLDYLFDCNIWKTAKGIEIPVSKMTENHLGNAIKYLERGQPYYRDTEWLIKLKRESKARAMK